MLLHLDRSPFIFCFPRAAGQHKAIASTDINLSICAGALICVSFRLNPLLFRQPNSVPVCQRAPYASTPCPLCHGKPPAVAHTSSPAPVFSLHLLSAPESGASTPALCHLFPLSAHLAADAVRNPCLTQIRQPFIANECPVSIEGGLRERSHGREPATPFVRPCWNSPFYPAFPTVPG